MFLGMSMFVLTVSFNAYATYYEFSQGGYDDAMEITGYFYGYDNDSDGMLKGKDEVTKFYVEFGNNTTKLFKYGTSFLNHIEYFLDGFLGDNGTEGVSAFKEVTTTTYEGWKTGIGIFGGSEIGGYVDLKDGTRHTTDVAVKVTQTSAPVPEPASMLLFGLGLLGLTGVNRRKE